MKNDHDNNKKYSLLIEAYTLEQILQRSGKLEYDTEKNIAKLFVQITENCHSVVCCRVSPK